MTGTEVFKRAVMLMDEQSAAGAAEWADTDEYQKRSVPLINTIVPEMYPYSDTYRPRRGRPLADPIASLTDEIDLDDGLAGGVLPYALAAKLCMDDNPRVAAYCEQKYTELLEKFKNTLPANWDTPVDVYGGIQINDFGRW